jgi:hypothetical protein
MIDVEQLKVPELGPVPLCCKTNGLTVKREATHGIYSEAAAAPSPLMLAHH